jgi:hypothetical protein
MATLFKVLPPLGNSLGSEVDTASVGANLFAMLLVLPMIADKSVPTALLASNRLAFSQSP